VRAAFLLIGLLANAPTEDVGALPDVEILKRAEEAFRQGVALRSTPEKARRTFAESAALYEVLRQRGADGADLLRNQGNAHLLADQLAHAILAYRRGLRQVPHDADLHERLEYARDQVAYPGPGSRGRPDAGDWPPWLPRLHPDLFLLLGFCLYALACVWATRWLMTRRAALLSRAAVVLALGAACAGVWGYLQWRAAREAAYPLVVIAEEVPLRRGNGPSYPSHAELPLLQPGMEARRLHERGGWLQVELAGGEVGWVPRAAALVDAP
jgi:hypothetical protein